VTAVTSVFRPEIAKLAKIIKLTMVDSDEDFSLGEEDEYTESDGCTKKHALEDIGPERAAKSVRSKSPKASNQTRALMPSTLEVLLPMEREASLLLQGIDYDRNTSARIIVASLRFQKEYLLKKSKNKCKNTPAPEVRNTVCRMLGVSPKVYTKIMSGYILHRSVYASGLDGQGRGGNSGAKSSRIPRTKSVSIAVREFVRGERKLQKLVTGREVLDFFIKEGILCIPMDPKMGVFVKKDFQTASRNVRRYLQDYGYRRGRRNNIAPNQSMIAKRHEYVQALFTNEALPKGERLRNVYMDESCIHEHYNKNDRSVWDPKDVLDIQHGKSKHKGRRYCFAAAIQGPDPFVDVPELASEKAGLVPGTIWAFCPQKKGSDQGDYHKVFNGENFVTWWKNQLLPNLHQPCLIHMDNAAYHKVYGSHVPKCGKMQKQECIDYLHSKGIETEAECSAVVLKVRTKAWIVANEKFECVRLAEEQGHRVLFTPPYHSDLQPIELVWALIKGNVGRQYSLDSTLDLVYQRLMKEFDMLQESGHDSIHCMIVKCTNLARQFKEDIPMEEAADEALEMEEADDYDAYKAGLDEGIPPENYPDESGEESGVEDVFGAASDADLKENGDIKDTVQV
jgi:hypothetical protein